MDEKIKVRYVGCFSDKSRRALPDKIILNVISLTLDETFISKCIETCKRRNYDYAGLQYQKECYCGHNYNRYGRIHESKCNDPCLDGSGKCGGTWTNSVYKTGNYTLTLFLLIAICEKFGITGLFYNYYYAFIIIVCAFELNFTSIELNDTYSPTAYQFNGILCYVSFC